MDTGRAAVGKRRGVSRPVGNGVHNDRSLFAAIDKRHTGNSTEGAKQPKLAGNYIELFRSRRAVVGRIERDVLWVFDNHAITIFQRDCEGAKRRASQQSLNFGSDSFDAWHS